MKKIFNIAVLLFVSVLVYGQSMVMSHSNKVLPYTVTNNSLTIPDVLTNTDSTLGWWEVAPANVTLDADGDSCVSLADLSTSGNHLAAPDGTGAAPYYEPGSDSLSFDGVGNYMYKAIAAADQPFTVYIVYRPVTYVASQVIFGGADATRPRAITRPGNSVQIFAGTALSSADNAVVYGSYQILRATFSGTNSVTKSGDDTVASGNAGTNDGDGFGIANEGAASSVFGRLAFKAAVLSVATSAETETEIYNYLKTKYGL